MHGGERAVLFHASLEFHQARMAAAVAIKDLFTRQANLDGPVQQERCLGYDDLVIKRIALPSKTSAIRGRNDANMRGRHFQNLGESAVKVMGRLGAGPDGQLSFGILDGDRSVLLDREMSIPLIEESIFEDFVGFGKAVVHVAKLQGHTLVNVSFSAVVVNPRFGGLER